MIFKQTRAHLQAITAARSQAQHLSFACYHQPMSSVTGSPSFPYFHGIFVPFLLSMGGWLKNRSIPWQRRRRFSGGDTFPCGKQLKNYGYRKTAKCMLCQKAYEERGNSWEGDLPKETIGHVTGHIQSVGGLGQREVIIARNACIRELLQNVNAHGKADQHLRLLTIETESNIGTLDQEECIMITPFLIPEYKLASVSIIRSLTCVPVSDPFTMILHQLPYARTAGGDDHFPLSKTLRTWYVPNSLPWQFTNATPPC